MDSMTKAFFFGLTDELEKAGKCATPGKKIRSKGKGKGLAIGKGKGPLGMPKKAMDIRAKIQAAKLDPSTKANPKDKGPKGSGLNDPRAEAMKGRGFGKGAGVISNKLYEKMTGKKKKKLFGKGGLVVDTEKKKGEKKPMKKKAGEAFFGGFAEGLGKEAWGGGLAKGKELSKHIQAAGGSVSKGVKSYNAAKKKERGAAKKGMPKTAEDAFFAGFEGKAPEEQARISLSEGLRKRLSA